MIGLMHMGVDEDSEFTSELIAKEVDGINLIVDGHSHTIFETGDQVNHTLFVSAGQYVENIGYYLIRRVS